MASIKIEVKKRVIEKLKNEQWKLRNGINRNARKINVLAEENTILKRELVELEDLIRATDI